MTETNYQSQKRFNQRLNEETFKFEIKTSSNIPTQPIVVKSYFLNDAIRIATLKAIDLYQAVTGIILI